MENIIQKPTGRYFILSMVKWIAAIKINCLLIILFGYTAISKLITYEYYKESMAKTPILQPHVNLLAWGIPAIELLVCLLLINDKIKKAGYYASLFLMIVFTGYIIFILVHYKGHLPCNCGGVIQDMGWKLHLIFNFFFLLLPIRGIYLMRKNTNNRADRQLYK